MVAWLIIIPIAIIALLAIVFIAYLASQQINVMHRKDCTLI